MCYAIAEIKLGVHVSAFGCIVLVRIPDAWALQPIDSWYRPHHFDERRPPNAKLPARALASVVRLIAPALGARVGSFGSLHLPASSYSFPTDMPLQDRAVVLEGPDPDTQLKPSCPQNPRL